MVFTLDGPENIMTFFKKLKSVSIVIPIMHFIMFEITKHLENEVKFWNNDSDSKCN